MRFLLAIYDEAERWADADEQTVEAEIDAYWALDAEAREQGAFVESAALHPATASKIVRVREGQPAVTDGPFAETKEQLGGFYLLECDSLEEATAWAAKVPAARFGTVEVRELMDYEAAGHPDPYREASRTA